MFVVKREVFVKILEEPEWARRLEDAKTVSEAGKVVAEWCRLRGFTVREAEL